MAAVVLVGFMGAGKTTVGRLVADRLGLPFLDSDGLIEERAGRPIRDLFATEGEAAFRELEHAAVAEALTGPAAVVAVGGGAVMDPRTQAALAGCRVAYLRVGYDEARERAGHDGLRPLLQRPDIEDVYRSRLAIYERVATLVVDTDGRDPATVADDLVGGLTAREEGRP